MNLIEQRGRCGAAPIGRACEDATRDGPDLPNLGPAYDVLRGGYYVPDGRFLSTPFAGDERQEIARWRVCPTSETRAVLPIVHLFRRHRMGIEPIDKAIDKPSAAILEAFEILAVAEIDVENAHQRLILERARNG